MDRRTLIMATLAEAGLAGSAVSAVPEPARMRVVYHLSDLGKVAFVLGNIRNHIAGVGGPEKVKIALVVHGPALQAFRRNARNLAISTPMTALGGDGVAFHACGNTLKSMDITTADLLDGFDVVEEGGVVKLAALQAAGWIYLRP